MRVVRDTGELTEIEVLSEDETSRVAARLAAAVAPGRSIVLAGPLGAGKTAFVRYFAAAAGCAEPVSSPSFVLEHEYRSADGRVIEHWDLYRLAALPRELEEPPGPGVIRLVEWGDRFAEFREECELVIRISLPEAKEGGESGVRRLEISGLAKGGPSWLF